MTQDSAAAGLLPAAADRWLARRRQDAGMRPYVVYVAAVLIFALFAVILRDDGFLSASNLLNIGRQAAPIAVMAVGMAFALAAAEIDLSVGSVTALSSLVAAEAVGSYGFAAGAAAALAVGAAIGLVNGVITVKVRIPSFLVTLGMLGIISGIARNMNNLQSLPIRNDTFLAVFGAGSVGPISSLLIWTVVVGLIGHLVLHQLRWGRHVLSVGGRPRRSGSARHQHRPHTHHRADDLRGRGLVRGRAAGGPAGCRASRSGREPAAHRDRGGWSSAAPTCSGAGPR